VTHNTGTRSAFEATEWMPIQESLMQGLVHACNNRVAALSGISQLYEAELSTGDEGMRALSSEIEKLRGVMGLFRTLLTGRGERREPSRMGEALQAATSVLTYHLDVRQAKLEAPPESGDVEPVLLWPGDALRFAVLAFLALTPDAGKFPVIAAVARVGDETVVSVTATGAVERVRAREEFRVLVAAAMRVGGSAQCGIGSGDDVMLTLAIPGINKATARV
jgi:hypothetical protein